MPNPAFNPPDMQARVMGIMGGEMIIVRDGNRIRTLKGHLTQEVKFGFGIFGHLNQGGTLRLDAVLSAAATGRSPSPTCISAAKALLFKNIGQQSDEVKTDWKPSPADTLEAAARTLGAEK